MNFDQKDIEAVAASRVNRAEAKRTQQWMVGICLSILIGAVIMTQPHMNKATGFVVLIVGFGIYLYWQNQISVKQRRAKTQLVQQWLSEQQVQK